jgi:hypothetical protein
MDGTEIGLVALAVLGFVAWLGGGRKWAFRMLLSALVLACIGAAGILLYGYGSDKVAERRARTIHECAIAKVARAQCVSPPPAIDFSKYGKPADKTSKPDVFDEAAKEQNKIVWDVCPPYWLPDNPTAEQASVAIAAAEEECAGEDSPQQKSLREQVSQYRREHGIKERATSGVDYDALAKQAGAITNRLSPKACAARVRTSYPGSYDDLDDAALTRKVLAKYPDYCDVEPQKFIPDIQGIR